MRYFVTIFGFAQYRMRFGNKNKQAYSVFRSPFAIFVCFVLVMLAGCEQRNPELLAIDELAEADPQAALARLDSIAATDLSDSDRHYYDLLTIKARDKAYVIHTSDSLIRDVLDYYESHDRDLRAEAFYYGGRVYNDLGDYPTALNYFHDALDLLPEDTDDLHLRSRVLSQTGRLLNSLRLYDEAIPYINQVIHINKLRCDTINYANNLQLLGCIYLRANKFEEAKLYLNKSLTVCKTLRASFIARVNMYLAEVYRKQENTDSALILIRSSIDHVEPLTNSTALALASEIYLQAGKIDSAYFYANELISTKQALNAAIGYHVILSEELRPLITLDNAKRYVKEYCSVLESDFDSNSYQLAVIQQSLYNYQLHEREKERAEAAKLRLKNIVVICIVGLLLSIGIVLLQMYRNQRNIAKLQHALSVIKSLKSSNIVASAVCEDIASPKPTESQLREQLREELLDLANSAPAAAISDELLSSEAYLKLQEYITHQTAIDDNNPIWDELGKAVEQVSPKFKANLMMLSEGRLNTSDYRTALLIKYGVTPTQMMQVFARAKGSISSRRAMIGFKIFEEKLSVKVIDKIIRSL